MTVGSLRESVLKAQNIMKNELNDVYTGASVLIPFVKNEDSWDILFEKRALDLLHQPGEICLPGGKREKGESAKECALRETVEELNVDSGNIEIIAELPVSYGPGMRYISVFAGIITDYMDTYDSDEVDSTYRVPLEYFLETEPKGYEVDMITVPKDDFPFDRIPGGKSYPWKSGKRTIYFYERDDIIIWGFTAGIMNDFMQKFKSVVK